MKQQQSSGTPRTDRSDSLDVAGGVVNRGFSGSTETPVNDAAPAADPVETDVETGEDLHLTRATTRNEELSSSAYDSERARQSRETNDQI